MTTAAPNMIEPTDKRGLELLDHVRDHIGDHLDDWDQTYWSERSECGTTFCVAGFAVVAAGATMLYDDCGGLARGVAGHCRLPDGRVEVIELYAAQLLGLDIHQATPLFFCNTSLEELDEVIDRIRAEKLEEAR